MPYSMPISTNFFEKINAMRFDLLPSMNNDCREIQKAIAALNNYFEKYSGYLEDLSSGWLLPANQLEDQSIYKVIQAEEINKICNQIYSILHNLSSIYDSSMVFTESMDNFLLLKNQCQKLSENLSAGDQPNLDNFYENILDAFRILLRAAEDFCHYNLSYDSDSQGRSSEEAGKKLLEIIDLMVDLKDQFSYARRAYFNYLSFLSRFIDQRHNQIQANLLQASESLSLTNLVSKGIIHEVELKNLIQMPKNKSSYVLDLLKKINNDDKLLSLMLEYNLGNALQYIVRVFAYMLRNTSQWEANNDSYMLRNIGSWEANNDVIRKINEFIRLYENEPEIVLNPNIIKFYKVPNYVGISELENMSFPKDLQDSLPVVKKILEVNPGVFGQKFFNASNAMEAKIIFSNPKTLTSKSFEYFLKLCVKPEFQFNSNLFNLLRNTDLTPARPGYVMELTDLAAFKSFAEELKFPLRDKFAIKFLERYFLFLPSNSRGQSTPSFGTSSARMLGILVNFLVIEWGKDINYAEKLAELMGINKDFSNFIHEFIQDTFEDGVASSYFALLKGVTVEDNLYKIPCSNVNQLASNWKQFQFIERKIHNNFNLSRQSVEYLGLVFSFLRGKYDINSDLVDKLVDLALSQTIYQTQDLEDKAAALNIDHVKLLSNLKALQDQFRHGRLSIDKDTIYQMDNEINLIETYDAIQDYKQYKQDKVPELYNLSYMVTEDLKFEVLANNSLEYFTVGSATGCCQRIRRPGAVACVDSYINPLAGVLVLRSYANGLNGKIISQSYFHYIPDDNGYILDNVESNVNLVKMLQVDLDQLYASLAAQVKKDYDISYFHCGKEFNKLSENQFASGSSPNDNRNCLVQTLGLEIPTGPEEDDLSSTMYSDYDSEEYLNLLRPKVKTIPLTSLSIEKISQLSDMFFLRTFNKLA